MDIDNKAAVAMLQNCCDKNRVMLEKYRALSREIEISQGGSSIDLGTGITSFQKEIEELDISVAAFLKVRTSLSEEEKHLLDEKVYLQQQILEMNKKIISRINTIKSTLAGEMQSLKHGRKAMNSYGGNHKQAGRLINKSG